MKTGGHVKPLQYINVDSISGLAEGREAFAIVGGNGAGSVRIARDPGNDRRGIVYLTANGRDELLAQYTAEELADPASAPRRSLNFEIRIIARDRYRRTSSPVVRAIRVSAGPEAAPEPVGATEPVERPATPLESAAYDLALLVDPNRTTAFFDARREALEITNRCRTANTDRFSSHFREMVERASLFELTANSLGPFLDSVCASWQQAQQTYREQQAEAARIQSEYEARLRAARSEAASRNSAAANWRYRAFAFALGCLVLLFALALPIALLAIENHTASMRLTAERLREVPAKKDGDHNDQSNPTPT